MIAGLFTEKREEGKKEAWMELLQAFNCCKKLVLLVVSNKPSLAGSGDGLCCTLTITYGDGKAFAYTPV